MRPAVAAFAAAVLLAAPAMAAGPAEPSGYRMDEYRSPVPETLEGATVVDVAAAAALWRAGRTAFVDVLPRPPKPANLPEGTVWRDKERRSIPGAVWLPNTGYGAIAEPTDAYLRTGLLEVTEGELDHPILFFCLTDCWMSWNAAKRALGYGYTDVTWFPGGTDAWSAAGHPTERVEPVEPQP